MPGQRVARPIGFDATAAVRNLPRAYGAKSQGGVLLAAIAASASASFTVQVQSGVHFLLKRITAGFNQNDWSFDVTIGAYQRSLFGDLLLGADHFFGRQEAAAPTAATRWTGGYHMSPPLFIPANSNVTIAVTNGATGVLNVSFTLHGEDLQAGV